MELAATELNRYKNQIELHSKSEKEMLDASHNYRQQCKALEAQVHEKTLLLDRAKNERSKNTVLLLIDPL